MESKMLSRLKSRNPDKAYPSNMGQKWTDEEETLLLEELYNNIDIEKISLSHGRSVGGILARRRMIAYKMYLNEVPMEEIVSQTRLDIECIEETIKRRQNNPPDNPEKIKGITNESPTEESVKIEDEIVRMKKDIKEIKKTINELFKIIKGTSQEL